MLTVSPVIQPASLDAKNAIKSATSRASPTRPNGCVVLLCSKKREYASSCIPLFL